MNTSCTAYGLTISHFLCYNIPRVEPYHQMVVPQEVFDMTRLVIRLFSLLTLLLFGGCAGALSPEQLQARNARLEQAFTEINPDSGTTYLAGSSQSFQANHALIEGRSICGDPRYTQEACTKAMAKGIKLAEQADSRRIKGEASTIAKIEDRHLAILLNRMPPLMGKLVDRELLPNGTRTAVYESPGGRFTLQGEDLPDVLLPEDMPKEYGDASLKAVGRLIGQMRDYPAVAGLTPEEAVNLYAARRLDGEKSASRQVAETPRRGTEPLYLELDPSRIRRGGNDYELDGGSYTIEDGENRICLPVRGQVGEGACLIAVRRDRNVQLCDTNRINCTQQLTLPVGNVRRISPLSRNMRLPTSLGDTEPVSVTIAGEELPGSFRYNLPGTEIGRTSRPVPIQDRRLGRCVPTGSLQGGSNFPLYTCENAPNAMFTYNGSEMTRVREQRRR